MTDVSGGAGHQLDEPQPTVKEGIAPKVLARRSSSARRSHKWLMMGQ